MTICTHQGPVNISRPDVDLVRIIRLWQEVGVAFLIQLSQFKMPQFAFLQVEMGILEIEVWNGRKSNPHWSAGPTIQANMLGWGKGRWDKAGLESYHHAGTTGSRNLVKRLTIVTFEKRIFTICTNLSVVGVSLVFSVPFALIHENKARQRTNVGHAMLKI